MKQLVRSRESRLLFGVCGGFGEYFGVDVDLVRAIWIVLILLGGIGIVPYVAAIFLLPEGEAAGEGTARPDRKTRNLGLVLIAAAAGILLFVQLGLSPVGFWIGMMSSLWGLLVPLALLVGGVLLVWPRLRGKVGVGREHGYRRSVRNRIAAGVCGGIAENLGLDPNLIRIAFVFLAALTSGIVVILYVLLIPLMPEDSVAEPPPPPVDVTPPAPPPPAAPAPDASEPAAEEPPPAAAAPDGAEDPGGGSDQEPDPSGR